MLTKETIDRLKAQLLSSGLSQKDQPLFQIINTLIEAARQSFVEIAEITGDGTSGGGGGVAGQSFITANNDVATLPNSFQLLVGNGLQFNRRGNQIIISAVIPLSIDGIDGEPGPIGPPGMQGPSGNSGPIGPPGIDCECECDSMPFVGTSVNGAAWTQLYP